jgi:hypothetical protein
MPRRSSAAGLVSDAAGMSVVPARHLAAGLLALLGVAYGGLAITAIGYGPSSLGTYAALTMAAAGIVAVAVALRFVAGRIDRRPAVVIAAVLGLLPLVPLAFDLTQWLAQREAFERAQRDPALSSAAPGALTDFLVVPALLMIWAFAAVVVIARTAALCAGQAPTAS